MVARLSAFIENLLKMQQREWYIFPRPVHSSIAKLAAHWDLWTLTSNKKEKIWRYEPLRARLKFLFLPAHHQYDGDADYCHNRNGADDD